MEFNYALLVKYLIGSLSSEEMEEVMRWRDLSAENETVFSEVLRLRLSWNTAKYADNERICFWRSERSSFSSSASSVSCMEKDERFFVLFMPQRSF